MFFDNPTYTHRIHGTGMFTYIWIHLNLIFIVNVGKCISPMDPVCYNVFLHQSTFSMKHFVSLGRPIYLSSSKRGILKFFSRQNLDPLPTV